MGSMSATCGISLSCSEGGVNECTRFLNLSSLSHLCPRNPIFLLLMSKKFTSQGHKKWLKILPEIIDKYNNKVHSTIKTTPMKASENPASIRGIVLKNNIENDLMLP